MPHIVQNRRQTENGLTNVGVEGLYMLTAAVFRGTTILLFGPE